MRSVAALLIATIIATTSSPGSPSGPGQADSPEQDPPSPSQPDTAPAGRLPPGPVVVESAPQSRAGVLGIDPGVAHLRVAAGESVQPELFIVNGAESPLDLTLAVASAVPAPDGAPTFGEPSEDAASTMLSAATWLALPASSLHLDPAEQARLRLTVSVPALAQPGGYVAALRATARASPARGLGQAKTAPHSKTAPRSKNAPPPEPGPLDASAGNPEVVAFILVEVPSTSNATTGRVTADAALMRNGLAGAEARIRLDAEQSEVVAGRLKVGGWWGATFVDVAIPPTIVLLAVPRTQQVGFRAPLLPGPYHLTASLETSSGETVSARATAWLWNPLATLVVLLAMLLVAVAIVTRAAVGRES